MNKWILLVVLALAETARAQFTPPPMLLYDSSGNPFPTGSGAALAFRPPAFTCYTIVSNAVVPCTFSGGGGVGTVTSFSAGNLSPLFTTSVATATTTPALTFALSTAAANLVLAGPTTGAAAAPTYRALVNADFASGLTFTSPIFVTPALGTPASGVITNLTGTCTACTANAAVTATSATTATTATSATTAANLSGGSTVTNTPAASTSAIFSNATLFTGGTGTTTFPYLFIQPASGAAAATTWSANGTYLGVNAPSGFTGNYIDFRLNGSAANSVFAVSNAGSVVSAGTIITTSTYRNTQNAGSYAIGSSSDTAWCRSTAGVWAASTSQTCNSLGTVAGVAFESLGTKFTATGCTSITATVGGASAGKFTIGASACTVVITMNGASGFTAANGWSCRANDETTAAGNTGLYFSTNNTTTATLTVPATAVASDVIDFACTAF